MAFVVRHAVDRERGLRAGWGCGNARVVTTRLRRQRERFSKVPERHATVVSRDVVDHQRKERNRALGLQRELGFTRYETVWTWLHKLHRAVVRPGRDRLSGRVEVNETYLGGEEEGLRGREVENKFIVAIAVEEDGAGMGGSFACGESRTSLNVTCCHWFKAVDLDGSFTPTGGEGTPICPAAAINTRSQISAGARNWPTDSASCPSSRRSSQAMAAGNPPGAISGRII